MAKHPNPVRGAVRCPVCLSASTVHQVGEGQLIATGEPPKNSRNLGLLYYRCPDCGNSSISKKVSEFITANMVNGEAELPALETEQAPLEGELLTAHEPLPSTKETVNTETAEASNDAVSSVNETVENEGEKTPLFSIKRVAMLLGLLLFVVWMVRQLMPKPQPKEAIEGTEVQHATA
ncbi:hypothetical protein BIT28_16425 [Photobacterium proteolyticum]|uniref:Uncharacterized protein n=1 Tax=Photobacterium proteolyticum TaxID=1903952 RepID=A0A1Q9G7L9_9GAMM|nr:hypothetical protein [Photobacterium proteolyticum]OLQ70310.1 hypothetical protein BIT28_16425 [Photobacterium proteolyticum]